jgi:hypothetical protein
VIIAVGIIIAGMIIVLWAEYSASREGCGGGWGGLARTLILIGGAFAAYVVLARGQR